MTDMELLVVILAVPVVLGNIWIYWRKWQRKSKGSDSID
ncbi:MAG: hypothetical protein ETSY2_40120 [Candidatus Entotheonella gemina]|uniref:Uncharacterized protein n=1 Tax=Candidatus Entotheonella gemina TaxID=1429439 RepID=W4LPK3_9BACT|nr:MAG: hypothetical protein ETSY2_40120 [Candidatus Entotheonella gemina]